MARKGAALTARPAPGYLPFSRWLRERYGFPVRKISLSAGFGCPNKDGTIGGDGCVFCDVNEAGPDPRSIAGLSVAEQLHRQITIFQARHPQPHKFLAYLQAGSNTYAPPPRLREVYRAAISHPDVVSLAVSTRPDWLPDEALDLLRETGGGLDVWVELGVQSAHDATLIRIRRRHDFAAVEDAVRRAKERGFLVCAHLIVGLPGETKADLLATAAAMNRLGVDAVKLHPLSVTRGSALETEWRENRLRLLDEDEYVELAAAFLETLSPHIVVQRLTGSGRPEVHLAPDWTRNLNRVKRRIEALLCPAQ
ncbi:MAG: TIGR01212 family radical SAM protein [Myxococcales bacterium]|nr:TIGR01212 family radical SAM protein [Myxococcales bacterium]